MTRDSHQQEPDRPFGDIPVGNLPNIGKVLARGLGELGVFTRRDLDRLGPTQGYLRLCDREQRRLPVCYYLYSLDAALKNRDWRSLSEATKARLRAAVARES